MTLRTGTGRTVDWSRISRLQGQELSPQISAIRSACGQRLRDNRNSINRTENVRTAEKIKQLTKRMDTTRRGMPMAEKLTIQITLRRAKRATRNYISHDE